MKLKAVIVFFFFLTANIAYSQTWHAVGKGVGYRPLGYVQSLNVIKDTLYVGGAFTKDYGAPGDGVASFNGANWDSLGCSYGIFPYSMDVFTDNKIYFGGGFQIICNKFIYDYIVKWDGTNWVTFGTDAPNKQVYSVATYNNELYIGGEFSQVGSMTANRIASWDGSNWHNVGGGVWHPMPHNIRAMAVYKGKLIVEDVLLKPVISMQII